MEYMVDLTAIKPQLSSEDAQGQGILLLAIAERLERIAELMEKRQEAEAKQLLEGLGYSLF